MPNQKQKKQKHRQGSWLGRWGGKWVALVLVAVPAVAIAGFSPQGFSPQGFSPQGFSPQGFSPQGFSPQGFSPQGVQSQGVAMLGTDLIAADLKGVDIGFVELRGTTPSSPIEVHELTEVPGMSTGSGDYITVGGGSAVGHYGVAHLVDPAGNAAEDLDIYISAQKKDPVPNLLHVADDQENTDVQLYTVFFFHKWSGQWASLCPYHADTGGNTAMAIAEDAAQPSKFIFACTATGVAAKCARIWGFRPWRDGTSMVWNGTAWEPQTRSLRPLYESCKLAARAGYCQDRQSFTHAGTLVDLFDTRQFVWPNAIENPLSPINEDSQWMFSQEYFISTEGRPDLPPALKASALQRTRYRELSPVGRCGTFADVDRLEHDHFEDGRWGAPLTNTPRIQVFSPNYCKHNEYEEGEGLPWDCSPCTTAVCKTNPSCCALAPGVNSWGSTCVAAALSTCRDGATQWPKGKVWPDDYEPALVPPPKYLLGPGGVVDRVDGVSTAAGSATVSGWACDPEWPGAALTVEVYSGAPRGQPYSTLVGTVYADQPVAPALAREVGAACDGPKAGTSRHAFSLTLPPGTAGNVFVYALDQFVPGGPDPAVSAEPLAPPTLLRNGIVHVPTCEHSEHQKGTSLAAGCSPCVAGVCGQPGLEGCCSGSGSGAWGDACVAAAAECSAAETSAATATKDVATVLTGWIEAPLSGTFTFEAPLVPSRLLVNGQKVLDWWDGPGPQSGAITLQGGGRYHLRWDRFAGDPATAPTGAGLTWQPPGAAGQTEIPSSLLYRVAPGAGQGLRATYYDSVAFNNPLVVRVDPAVALDDEPDAAVKLPLVIAPSTFSVVWEGEITPFFSDDYTFSVVSSGEARLMVDGQLVLGPEPPPVGTQSPGCAHDVCAVGGKLLTSSLLGPACHPCVEKVCEKDPFCCEGGYLSYYSTEPVWDAKCVVEATRLCQGLGVTCTNPLPSPTTRERGGVAIALKAGARYPIKLMVSNPTSDVTTRLQWESPHQIQDVVPTAALFAPRPAANAGSGLNFVTLPTTPGSGGVGPAMDTANALASGTVSDLQLAPAVGANGLPQVPVVATAADVGAATPPSPGLVSPTYDGRVYFASTHMPMVGLGGVLGAFVHVEVAGHPSMRTVMPVGPGGIFTGKVDVPGYGKWTLILRQKTFGGTTCVSPPEPTCLESAPVQWIATVSPKAPAAPPAPTIATPQDLTASMATFPTKFPVTGKGTPGSPLGVTELNGFAVASGINLAVADDGTISGKVELSTGASEPNRGWHKLVFSQGGTGSKPVFVSVGIQPPTVEFPRSGAEIDCKDPKLRDGEVEAKGRIPYAPGRFGNLLVREETGRFELGVVRAEVDVSQTPNQDGSFNFTTQLFLEPGKHLLYFFQAPPTPPNATPAEVQAHLRFFASLANTPQSRIEIRVPPRPMAFPLNFASGSIIQGTSVVVGETFNPAVPAQPPGLASPFADVNVYDGQRLFTSRANAQGSWAMLIDDLQPGWHQFKITQVLDSSVGGGWTESCPPPEQPVGVVPSRDGAPTLHLPKDIKVEGKEPGGAKVKFEAFAVAVDGNKLPVTCVPPSESVFPFGQTEVLCSAFDPKTGGVGLGRFFIGVIDGPPVVHVPLQGIVAEADSRLGALVSYEVTADDAVDGPLPVECAPSAPPGAPVLFPLDEDTEVLCQATDSRKHTTTEKFLVRVQDTTPPVLCHLANIAAESGPQGVAQVFFATCARDLVDGDVGVSCDHPSGSLFPVGVTTVKCTATDRHKNTSAPSQFTVKVGDKTPPVLKLPGTIKAFATTVRGARVGYTVTATDNDGLPPAIACAPRSGSLFPPGITKVTCTATDSGGNQSQGSFNVQVLFAWSGLLSPLGPQDNDPLYFKLPIPVHFGLVDGSDGITDLQARLYVAPVDAAGKVGKEKPAVAIPPSGGNLFTFVPFLREYALVLDTRPLAVGTWQLRVDLGDGATYERRIVLKKPPIGRELALAEDQAWASAEQLTGTKIVR